MYFAPMEAAAEVDRIFSSLYFERLRIPSAVGTPDEIVENLKKELERVALDTAEAQKKLADYWQSEASRCQQVYSQLKELDYYFSVRRYAARYNDKFILAGWLPHREEKALRAALDKVDGIEYSFEQPSSDTHHVPPVKLRNCRLFRPFEFFVDMYGLPRYNEIDPTAFVAITYTILFGIMFGDLGQGVCVAVIGWLMWKYKKWRLAASSFPAASPRRCSAWCSARYSGLSMCSIPLSRPVRPGGKTHRGDEPFYDGQHHPRRRFDRPVPHHGRHGAQHRLKPAPPGL